MRYISRMRFGKLALHSFDTYDIWFAVELTYYSIYRRFSSMAKKAVLHFTLYANFGAVTTLKHNCYYLPNSYSYKVCYKVPVYTYITGICRYAIRNYHYLILHLLLQKIYIIYEALVLYVNLIVTRISIRAQQSSYTNLS